MKSFLNAIQSRRSIYQIGKDSPIPDGRIRELVAAAAVYTPSAFHMQSERAVLLLGQSHARLWEIVRETLRGIVAPDKFPATEKKVASFAAGHGTVLFYADREAIERCMEENPLYSDKFPVFAQHSNGMMQYAVWNLLECEGLGASLQHYNPLIDEAVAREWDLPKSWELVAQMPFGEMLTVPPDIVRLPAEQKALFFG